MFSQQIFLQGLGMGASLIMPIGAQNAYVIRTGVSGRHVGLTVAACIVVDIGLIALGMAGLGRLVGSGITSLAQPTHDIGVTAFECLLNRLRGDQEPVRLYDFPARLIVRGSTRDRS